MTLITAEKLKKIVDLVETVPQEYRQKCFEILLTHALQGATGALPVSGAPQAVPPPPPPTTPQKTFVLPIDVKAFLSQYKLDESILWKFFIVEGNQLRPIYHLKANKKAAAQIQHTLMMALENALVTGQFQCEIETIRERCTDQKCYDSANFMATIKNNAGLFKGIETDKPLSLSPDGKSELADLLESLKG